MAIDGSQTMEDRFEVATRPLTAGLAAPERTGRYRLPT
jgi:hypothetical protein